MIHIRKRSRCYESKEQRMIGWAYFVGVFFFFFSFFFFIHTARVKRIRPTKEKGEDNNVSSLSYLLRSGLAGSGCDSDSLSKRGSHAKTCERNLV